MFDEYKKAVLNLFEFATMRLATQSHPLLEGIVADPVDRKMEDSSEPSIGQGYSQSFEGKFEITIDLKDIINGNLDSWRNQVRTVADQRGKSMLEVLISTVDGAATKAGNVMKAGGKPLSHDLILDFLEKMDMSFDEDGNPGCTQVQNEELCLIKNPGV